MQVHAGRVGVLETKPYGGVCRVESVLLNGLRSVVELPPSSVLNEPIGLSDPLSSRAVLVSRSALVNWNRQRIQHERVQDSQFRD
jgi:hypothetical protein